MRTVLEKINREYMDQAIIDEAGQIINKGGLVAFPTETVYGLGADGLREAASKKIYETKGRPSDNPLILHIAKIESLEELAVQVSDKVYALAEVCWPGPLTIVLKKCDKVPLGTTGGLDTGTVGMPQDKIAMALTEESRQCIQGTSAKRAGEPSPTKH